MADTPDLGSGAERCVGSSPILGTSPDTSLIGKCPLFSNYRFFMKKSFLCLIHLSVNALYLLPVIANPNAAFQKEVFFHSLENEAQAAFQYYCHEVEKDATLSHEEQHEKIQEFKNFAESLTPIVASRVTTLLLEETRVQIFDMLKSAGLDSIEMDAYLADYEKAILQVQYMNVEIARQMLFFVAELKIHRQYVYDFGVALECPEKQLRRHDLCKLSLGQFEGYARYFRGGRQDEDRAAFLAAWELHQLEEHHLESYSKKGFDFASLSEEHLQKNMLETVADWLAASKQRGGGTLINYLVNDFAKKKPHPGLLPYLEEALKKAHALYLNSEENPDSDSIFKGFPCYNSEVEKVFQNLKNG